MRSEEMSMHVEEAIMRLKHPQKWIPDINTPKFLNIRPKQPKIFLNSETIHLLST